VSARRAEDGSARRPVVLTWGLLGPDKGIEFGIEAVSRLRDLDPPPRYVVCGDTHPRVVESDGEAYRESLLEQVRALGIGAFVEFDAEYVDKESVLAWIRESDVVLLPYRSRDQVVSGVLVEAIASGKPVVATRFPHAVEMLSEGSGILVPHDDPAAIASALRMLLSDPELAARAAAVARGQAPTLAWEHVGSAYRELADRALRKRMELVR
jgi:polysaccharide biosynthesis protein PslF